VESIDKSQRLIEAASAILNVAPERSLNVVVLNKVLFYLDLAALRDRGDTITHNTYIAIQNGPVVAKYQQRLIRQLEELGVARQISQWNGSKPIILQRSPEHFEFLDSEALSTVAEVTNFFADATSRIASEFSHLNSGWKLAWDHYLREGQPTAINMRIAMQQIIESDPWMRVPLSTDPESLAAADEAIGDDW